ncbi:hypothetical protein [Oryza sativa Japonica Group]|uniref:Uncharacterized protein n=1 Tax=Oryza sativa subsp. japonica TaxID=39947 RepID=Q5ZEI2_ORYSJ|nr:hypothetical protein [Oryza sativa Japonica Group]
MNRGPVNINNHRKCVKKWLQLRPCLVGLQTPTLNSNGIESVWLDWLAPLHHIPCCHFTEHLVGVAAAAQPMLHRCRRLSHRRRSARRSPLPPTPHACRPRAAAATARAPAARRRRHSTRAGRAPPPPQHARRPRAADPAPPLARSRRRRCSARAPSPPPLLSPRTAAAA